MKKISVILASGKGENSITLDVMKDIIDVIKKNQNQIEVNYFYLDQLHITMCNECESCFRYGVCPLDETDDVFKIKRELLKSDYILWGTGVILHHVNPYMSILFQRLAIWSHVFGLAGIGSSIIVTGSTNGFQQVLAYMKKILSVMGTSIEDAVAMSYFDLNNEEVYGKVVTESAEKVIRVINDRNLLSTNEIQEVIFKKMKQILSVGGLSDYESQYWESHKISEFDSFEQYISSNKVRESLPG